MSRILVPVDFSSETPEVIECAAMVARRNRSELVLMHVAPGAGGREEDLDAADKLARLEKYLREEGFQVSSALREGEPAREIVEFGGAIQADCIIMGRHGHAAAVSREANPVTAAIEQKAPCTVVLVP